MKLKPYPKYKPSGLPWLGEVPGHWDVRSLGSLTSPISLRGRPDLPLLSVVREKGVIVRSVLDDSENHNFIPDDLSNYKVVHEGDLVINKMKAWQGSLGIAPSDGIVSPAYYVFDLAVGDRRYGEALLRSKPYVAFFGQASDGVRIGQWDLSVQRMKRIPVVLPPLPEQAAIVCFLDHADRRIQKYIRAKQKLIKLLEEQHNIMTEAALRLGNARSLRIGAVADRIERFVDRHADETYTPIGLYNRGRGIFQKAPTLGSDLGDSIFFWIAEDDLVLSGQFAWEGAVALAGARDNGCVASHRYPVLRGRPDMVESAFLLSFLRTGWGQLLLDHHSRGAAGRNRPLNATTLMKEKIPLPPLPVQKKIAALVHLESRAREDVAELLTLLREYRTRLIADVVTGKLDVRGAAAHLPDEAEEPQALDDAEDLPQAAEEAGEYDGSEDGECEP